MAGTASNDPYHRVSQDNGVLDGSLIGMGVGAAASGATVGIARMRYGGIQKRAERDQQVLKNQQEHYLGEVNQLHDRTNAKAQKIRQKAPSKAFADHRVNKFYGKQKKKFDKLGSRLQKVNDDLAHVSNVEGIKQRSLYGKHMGGWKNAAIIGASAIVGGGLGMISDAVTDQ